MLEELNTFLSRMPEETYARMLDAMGDHLVEVRLALLFLCSANADGALHGAELEAVAAHLQPVLEASRTGREDAASILAHARRYLDDSPLVDETIRLFAEYSTDALAVMCSAMQRVAASDGDLAASERLRRRRRQRLAHPGCVTASLPLPPVIHQAPSTTHHPPRTKRARPS